jgi:hypothetical protein
VTHVFVVIDVTLPTCRDEYSTATKIRHYVLAKPLRTQYVLAISQLTELHL